MQLIYFKHGYLMKIPIRSSKRKSEYSVYVCEALNVRLFPNKRLNVVSKNIKIMVSHHLKITRKIVQTFPLSFRKMFLKLF